MNMKSNSMPQRLRLKDTHSTAIKLQKIFDLADELGISFSFSSYGVYVSDRERDENLPDISIEDIETGHLIDSLPPTTEFKLTYDNPEYLKQVKIENQEYNAKRAEEERLKKEKELAKKAEEEARRAAALEAKERAILAELKAKYKD